MIHHHRALIALVLTTVLTASGFAVASAQDSRTRTRSSERSARGTGFLGVNLQNLSEGLADSYDYDGKGVVVSSVIPGGPADRAGVREGDIITSFNGSSVSSAEQLTRRVRALSPGRLADLSVWRDGKERDLERVEIGKVSDAGGNDGEWTPRARREVIRIHEHDNDKDDDAEAPVAPRAPRTPRGVRAPAPPPPDQGWNKGPGHGMTMMQLGGRGRLGIETRDLDDELGEYFDSRDGKGVLVLRVLDDTPARRAGLKAGDVILSIDGEDVENGEDLRKEIRAAKAGSIELRIRRRGTERTIEATLGRAEQGFMGGTGGNWMGRSDGDDFQGGMSAEDKAALKKDLEKLREDLREMHQDRRDDRDDDREDD